MTPAPTLFYCEDFRELNKIPFPATLHLKGTLCGEASEKTTNKGVDQIVFHLLDSNKRSIPCIAHDTELTLGEFREGKEVALFYVVLKHGLHNGPGNLWLYQSSFLLTMGQRFLPGSSVEEIALRGKV